ncbi:MAG: CHAT domain-containing protein [Myxococcales bacterium]|nr:CHAT domain-containing protein [Myxococcales bacterium]
MHLRRAVEATEGTSFEDGAGRWDHLLPADPSLRLDAVVERLVADGDAALARRLCAAGRRRALGLGARRPAPWAADIRDAHQVGFRAVWLGQGEPPEAEPTLEVGATEAAVWPRLRTGAADLQLEFRCFEDVTFLFATHGQGVRAHRIERGLGAWATDVDALRDASSSAGTRLEAVGTAIYNRLLGPVADLLALARRVIFVPDGPLFDLPFGLLRNDAGPLGEGMEMVVACPCAGPAFAGPPAPPAARIIGDDATARDLRISTLSGQGFFSAVEVRHGGDLTPAGLPGAVSEARVVHILGAIEADGGLGLIADGPSTPAADLGDALAEAGAVCATLMGPVEGDAGHAVVAELLPAVRGGVLVRRWETEEDGSFLLHFLAGAAHATDTWALAEALSAARRAAVRAQLPPSVWAAYALFVAET